MRPPFAARRPQHEGADPADGAGGLERRHQYEQHRHGQHAGVPEAGQGLGRGQHARHDQHGHGAGQDLVRREPLPQQHAQGGQDHSDRQPSLPTQCHRHAVCDLAGAGCRGAKPVPPADRPRR